MGKFRKLGRNYSHRLSLLRTMVSQLVKHERIETTLAKAKEVRRKADQMVQLGKELVGFWEISVGSRVPHCEGKARRGMELNTEGKLGMRRSSKLRQARRGTDISVEGKLAMKERSAWRAMLAIKEDLGTEGRWDLELSTNSKLDPCRELTSEIQRTSFAPIESSAPWSANRRDRGYCGR